jgi:hypothetical protein
MGRRLSAAAGTVIVATMLLACDDDLVAARSCVSADVCDHFYVDTRCPSCEYEGETEYCTAPIADPNASDVRCVLEALRDRTRGRVSFALGDSYCGESFDITIVDDRSAWIETSRYEDLPESNSGLTGALLPAEDYQACLDAGPAGAVACLRSGLYDGYFEEACSCELCGEPYD